MADLAMELVSGIRIAALRAQIRRKDVHPRVFKRMKLKVFREAGVGEDVVGNAMGLRHVGYRRRPEQTLVEARRVLGEETGWWGRGWRWVKEWMEG